MNRFILVLIIFSINAKSFAQNAIKNFIDQNYIEVSGIAEIEVIPDLIYLHITLSEKDKKGKVSVEEQEAKMLSTLKIIDESIENNISVISFSSTYIHYFFKKSDVEKVKQYELLLTDAVKLAPVFAALDELAISNVSIVKLDHSKIDELKQKIKVEAIIAAKKKAELYTKAINQSIGKALFIKEMSAIITQNSVIEANTLLRNESQYLSKVSIRDHSFPIQLRKINIATKVLTKFELK